MTRQSLLSVALRLLGFWVVLSHSHRLIEFALLAILPAASMATVGRSGLFHEVISSCVASLVLVGIGVVLIWLAPRIARRFYPIQEETIESISCSQIGLGGIYRIAAFLMGIYIATLAVAPLLHAFQMTVLDDKFIPLGMKSGFVVIFVVQGGLYLLCGSLLVFGSPAIGRIMGRIASRDLRAKLSYDENALPNPQFTLKVILIVITLAAILFGLLTWLARSIGS
ncbi:MAG TPA: hypothetical protein VJL29_09160 [Thermoguttaceae bacterium]|nr:hypothetical protein [Thermoguttaceae bacterium]